MTQPRDYRRMLYRLDRATKHESVPALVQHMMDETVLDGILELRMITSTSQAGSTGQPTQTHLPSTFISFRREGREVNAVALYGPRYSRKAPNNSPPGRSSAHSSSDLHNSSLEVIKRYQPRTTLVWVFSPLVQRILNEGASTVLFECRSYLASSDVAREVRAADVAAAAAAAERREQQYQHPPPTVTYQNPDAMYDPNMYGWHANQDQSGMQMQTNYPAFAVASSAWNPGATYPLNNSLDVPYIEQQTNHPGYNHATFEQSYMPHPPNDSNYSHTSLPSTHSSQRSQRPSSRSPPKPHRTTPSPPRVERAEDPATELLTRRAPFKRMLGYAGKQHDGSVAVYELADEVAAVAFTDTMSGIGMTGVEAMARPTRHNSPHANHSIHGSGSSRRI